MHLNLLKHQPSVLPLKTLLQSLCACSAAPEFQAGRGVCCCSLLAPPNALVPAAHCLLPLGWVTHPHSLLCRTGAEKTIVLETGSARQVPASSFYCFPDSSLFLSHMALGHKPRENRKQADQLDTGEREVSQRQKLSNCPICSEGGACASVRRSFHRGNPAL